MTYLFSRFVPKVHALVPIVGGVAWMNRTDFWKNNVLSVRIWVLTITLTAYFLGHIPFVKNHFLWIMPGAMGISLIPLLAITFRSMRKQVE